MRRLMTAVLVVAIAVYLHKSFYPDTLESSGVEQKWGPISYYESQTKSKVEKLIGCLKRPPISISTEEYRQELDVCMEGTRLHNIGLVCVDGQQSIDEDPTNGQKLMAWKMSTRDDGSGELVYLGWLQFVRPDGSVAQTYEFVIFTDGEWRHVFYPA
ncbi:MAG: hypothetical protein WC052_03665 [Patescibacteria group bacterium]|jgi:hypothetical protein